MIEKVLTDIGLKCGTVKNLSTVINEALRNNDSQSWYFLTPLKVKDNGSGLKEVTFNLAFPILATQDDISEQAVLSRISLYESGHEEALIKFLSKYFLIPSFTFAVVPFWSKDSNERTERKDFANNKVHLISGNITLRYREKWFNCECN